LVVAPPPPGYVAPPPQVVRVPIDRKYFSCKYGMQVTYCYIYGLSTSDDIQACVHW